MAKATKRKRPAARKPSARKSSRLALTGWIVAAGVGIAWASPHIGTWTERLPSVFALPDEVANLIGTATQTPVRTAAVEPRRVVPQPARPVLRPIPTPVAVAAAEVRPHPEPPLRKPVLPPLRPQTSAAIAAKAEPPKMALPSLKPAGKSAPKLANPVPPAAVPPAAAPSNATSGPLLASAIQRASVARPGAGQPTSERPGEIAIRRYPFTTAPAIAQVGDLRTLRIIGGQGDWKKVEIVATRQVGWLRLQAYAPRRAASAPIDRAVSASPARVPAAPLLREADAAVSR